MSTGKRGIWWFSGLSNSWKSVLNCLHDASKVFPRVAFGVSGHYLSDFLIKSADVKQKPEVILGLVEIVVGYNSV